MSRPSALCPICNERTPTTFTDGWGRICTDCAAVRRERGLDPTLRDGAPIRANVRGVGKDGKVQPGASEWHWRPPEEAPDTHHTDEIQIGGKIGYQQAPPIHVAGARAKPVAAASWGGRGIAAAPRKRAEAAHDLAAVLDADDGPLTDRDRTALRIYVELPKEGRLATMAAELGLTETAAAKLVQRAKAKARRQADRTRRSAITEDELRVER